MSEASDRVIAEHERAGRSFEALGVRSFALDEGSGPPVVLIHGVPTSSFLYRKVVPLLARDGFRAVAFDLPGLGLAERPSDFDYSWSGLARFTDAAIRALEVDSCHLVVHDIGGPIGCEWAIRNPDRVLSLTALNTLLDVARFRRPWSMRPFAVPVIGDLYLRSMTRFAFAQLFYLQGIADRSAVSRPEIDAYFDLLKREDGGSAFLRIMRGFELGRDKEDFYRSGFTERPYLARVVWGVDDPALGEDRRLGVQEILRAHDPLLLPAKHFLTEDQAPAVAGAVAGLARQVE